MAEDGNHNQMRGGVWFGLIEYSAACDAHTVITNQHVHEDEHSRKVDDVEGSLHVEQPPEGYKSLPHPYYEVHNNNKYTQLNNNGYDEVPRSHQEYPNEDNLKDHQCKDIFYNGDTNNDTNFTTIYLAGYDDQIFKLMYDIQRQGAGRELLIHFYLLTNNSYRNIGHFCTNKNILQNIILKYTHYFCINYNKSAASCLECLGKTNPEVKIGPEINEATISRFDIADGALRNKDNIKPELTRNDNINNKINEPKEYYPVKQTSESYEFILPKENDIKFKDIYIDLLKSKNPKILSDSLVTTVNDNLNNVEQINNISNTYNPKLYQEESHHSKEIPYESINVDANTKNPVDAYILIDSINTDKDIPNNEGSHIIYEVSDQNINPGHSVVNYLPNEDSFSNNKLKPCSYKNEHNHLISMPQAINTTNNMNSEVTIVPNGMQKNIETQNTITLPNNLTYSVFDRGNESVIAKGEYADVTTETPEFTLENVNAANQEADARNINGEYTIIHDVPTNRVIEINPKLEIAKELDNKINTKLINENILLSSDKNVLTTTPQIDEMDIVKNKESVGICKPGTPNSNDNSNIIYEVKPHNHIVNDISWYTPSMPTVNQIPNSLQAIASGNIPQNNRELKPVFTLEAKPPSNKETESVRYVSYENQNKINEINKPLIVKQVGDLNTELKPLKATNNSKLINDKYLNAIYYNISNVNLKKELQNNLHDYYNEYTTLSKPCNNINKKLFDNKPHTHIRPWTSQYGDITTQNRPTFGCLDHYHKTNVPISWPYYGLQTTPVQNTNLYTSLNPLKYMSPPNYLLKPFSNNKNIIKYLESIRNLTPESILDLSKLNLNNELSKEKTTQPIEENLTISTFDEKKYETSGNQTALNKQNKVSNPTASVPFYPNTIQNIYGYKPNYGTRDLNTYYKMPDPCTYKNIFTLEGNKEQVNGLTSPTEIIDKSGILYVNKSAIPIHQHVAPANEKLQIQTRVPIKPIFSGLPRNQIYNSYLSNLPETKEIFYPQTTILTSFKNKTGLSNIDPSRDLSNTNVTFMPNHIHPGFVCDPRYKIINAVSKTEEKETPLISPDNGKTFNIPEIKEPIVKYINFKPPSSNAMAQETPLNHFEINNNPSLHYPTLLNNKPLNLYNKYWTELHSHSTPTLSQSNYLQQTSASDSYSYITPKTEQSIQISSVAELPNEVNYNQTNLNKTFLENVTPTILSPCYKNPIIIDSSYYPFSSVPVTQKSTHPLYTSSISPLQDKRIFSHFVMPTNVLSPQFTKTSLPCQSTLNLVKQNPYYIPQSKFVPYYLSPKEIISNKEKQTSTSEPQLGLFGQNPNVSQVESEVISTPSSTEVQSSLSDIHTICLSNENKIQPNIVNDKTSTVIPLSKLIENKQIIHQLPIISNTCALDKPVSVKEALLQPKQLKPQPLITEGDKYTSEPTLQYSYNNPVQHLLQETLPSSYISLPDNIKLFIPYHQSFKVNKVNKALPQNMRTHIDSVHSNSISYDPNVSSSKTSTIQPYTDITNFSKLPHISPIDTKLSSITQPQSTILLKPILYKTESHPSNSKPAILDEDKYSVCSNPFGTNILHTPLSTHTHIIAPQNMSSENEPVLSKDVKPLDFTPKAYSPDIITTNIEKPTTFAIQSLVKYVTPNEILQNAPPKIFIPTSTEISYKDSKQHLTSSKLTPNYMSPNFANVNINPWLLTNYNNLPSKTQGNKKNLNNISQSDIKPTELLTQGKGDNVPSADNVIVEFESSEHKSSSELKKTLAPTHLHPTLFTPVAGIDPSLKLVQPCQMQKPSSNIVSPYLYSPTTSQPNLIYMVGPWKLQSQKSISQDKINNAVNPYAPPRTIDPVVLSQKALPIKYAENYVLPRQVTHTISNPCLQVPSSVTMNGLPNQIQTPKFNNVRPTMLLGNIFSPKPKHIKTITPQHVANTIYDIHPFSYSQSKITSIPEYSNTVLNPMAASYPALQMSSGFDKLTSPTNFSSNTLHVQHVSQENIPPINIVTQKPQIIPPDVTVSPVSYISAGNSDIKSNPYEPKPSDISSVYSSPLGFYPHVTYLLNSSPNTFKTMWPCLLPYFNKVITDRRDNKTLSDLTSSNLLNFTSLPSLQNVFTSVPSLGPMESYSKSISKPTLQATYASPCYNYLQTHIHPAQAITKKPMVSSSSVYDTVPLLKTDDTNETDKNYTYLLTDPMKATPSVPFIQNASYNQPNANFNANLDGNGNFTSFSLSDTNSINSFNSASVPLKMTTDSLPTSPSSSLLPSMRVPYSSPLIYTSEGHIHIPKSTISYTPFNPLVCNTLTPYFPKPESKTYISGRIGKTPPISEYTSFLPHMNLNLQSSMFSPYYHRTSPLIKETNPNPNSYHPPLSNHFKYDTPLTNHISNKNIETTNPLTEENVPLEISTDNDKNIKQSKTNEINEINNNLKHYIKHSDLLPNILNEKVITIPLENIGVAKFEETGLDKACCLKTDNPDIGLYVFPTEVKIVKAKIVLEYDKLHALNFIPVVKGENAHYNKKEVQDIVVDFVNKTYGAPIIIKAVQDKPYAYLDHIDESCIKNDKIYIVWSNVCDCGCNKIGCQCRKG